VQTEDAASLRARGTSIVRYREYLVVWLARGTPNSDEATSSNESRPETLSESNARASSARFLRFLILRRGHGQASCSNARPRLGGRHCRDQSARGERAAAIAGLEQERDSAVAALQASIRLSTAGSDLAGPGREAALARPRFQIALPAGPSKPARSIAEQVVPSVVL